MSALASLDRTVVNVALAEEALRGLDAAADGVTVDLVVEEAAIHFGVSVEDLRGASRSRVIVNARQVAMYLCWELTDVSRPDIGRAFGGRDLTVVLHAVRKIRQQMAERRSLFGQIAEITRRVLAHSR